MYALVIVVILMASLGQGLDLDKVNARLADVRRACGDLCDASVNRASVDRQHGGDALSAPRHAHIDCPALLSEAGIDAGWWGSGEARSTPEAIPPSLLSDFTMGGKVALRRWKVLHNTYLNESSGPRLVWTREVVDRQVEQARRGSFADFPGTYDTGTTQAVRRAVAAADVPGASALVIGSEKPWLEALLLEAGAANVTTLEYSEIRSEHPRVRTLTPERFRADSHLSRYDVIATISSVEHPGLGRYGDALNPWGDLIAVARAWCVAKPGAKLIIAVPISQTRDTIVWNAHREYGPLRYPHLVTNWKFVWADPKLSGGARWQQPRVYVRLPNAPRAPKDGPGPRLARGHSAADL